jgi:hypothetical protein
MKYPMEENDFQAIHAALLESSFQQVLHKSLIAEKCDSFVFSKALFNAPFAIVSHGTEDDPVFNYANRKALELFEMDWQEFTNMPSRLSAEPMNREARQQLLQQVSQFGYIDNYQGIRISKTGKRFLISNAIVWNLYDQKKKYQGQAACFNEYIFLD